METLETKVTRLGNGLYGCRIIRSADKKPIVELRVEKSQIRNAMFDMLRTLDKLGYDSPMAHASRHRGKACVTDSKYIWH
ncbi:hypothetical protein [Xanthomonas phage X1]|nr:hypothetical protein [Xanthomonas phage X1]